MYSAVKHAHIAFAAISGIFFLVRGSWMVMESGMLQKRWVRVVPHINDTLLLVCGVTLSVLSRQYPFVANWLTVKVVLLVAYIVLGAIALKRGKTKRVRIAAFVGALCCFLFIVSVAVTKQPWGILYALHAGS